MLLTLNILPSSRKSLIILSIVHWDQFYFIALVAITNKEFEVFR